MHKCNLLDYFDETVAKYPGKTAVIHGMNEMTFSDLQKKSLELADYISEVVQGAVNRPICIFLPKSINVVISDIAVIYSHNLFNNLDIKTPTNRLKNIFRMLQPSAVITDDKYLTILQKISNLDFPIINLDHAEWGKSWGHKAELSAKREKQIDTDPLCIINTSGSTGTPKGVLLTHCGFIDYVNWAIDRFHFNGTEILGVMSAIVFDHYVYETCLMMIQGVTLVLLNNELAAFPARLLEEVRQKKINYIFWVPTIMVNIANMGLLDKIRLPDLKLVWFAGEVFPTKQFNEWRRAYPDVIFVNLYGPCEITVDCTYYVVDRPLRDDEPVPIGIPRRDMDVFLMEDGKKVEKIGAVGEVCVRGIGLAMGYYNNPEKTSKVFIQNPLNSMYPERIYCTGDLAYWDAAGQLVFKGRKDSLIKHMGNRVNLGEIEHIAVDTLKVVSNCCVVYNFEKKIITMFYESNGKSILAIRKALATQMPRYMVPNEYIEIEQLPRNTNGKIDRHFLSDRVNQQN